VGAERQDGLRQEPALLRAGAPLCGQDRAEHRQGSVLAAGWMARRQARLRPRIPAGGAAARPAPGEAAEARASDRGVRLDRQRQRGYTIQKAPFSDIRVRRALARANNLQEGADANAFSQGHWVPNPVVPAAFADWSIPIDQLTPEGQKTTSTASPKPSACWPRRAIQTGSRRPWTAPRVGARTTWMASRSRSRTGRRPASRSTST
jgi:hypothetical protein